MIAKTFSDLIGTWPQGSDRDGRQLTSIATFAADIGIAYDHAQIMRHRNSIGPDHWPAVIKAAKRRGSALTHEELSKMREKRRGRKSSRPKRQCSDDEAHSEAA